MRKRMWEIKSMADKQAEIYIYGDVESDSSDLWSGEAIRSETSANALRDTLAEAGELERIDIYINSYGGSVFEGTAIYNQLRRHPAHKVVHIDGFACSIASVIAMAGDEVLMPRNALMMIHNAWMVSVGNAAELRKAADDLDTINAAGRQAYLLKSGGRLGEDKLIEMMDAETWLTAAECIEYGLADGYAEEDAHIDEDMAVKTMDKISAKLRQRIGVQKSIAAQLRELSRPVETESTPEKAEEKKIETPSLMAMLAGLK